MISLVKEEDNHVVAKVNLTEANLSHSDHIKNELIALLDQKKCSIWLDMQTVTYVDSSFLGALVAALKHAIGMHVDVVLLGLQRDIEDLLKLIRLDKVFKLYGSEQEAQKAIK